jgi:Predicted 3'-5' exonuclease related to the exonuclease domain of PolB
MVSLDEELEAAEAAKTALDHLSPVHREGRIREIAEYCESDVLNTYRVWLRYELFRRGISYDGFRASEDNLTQFIAVRGNSKPHLADLVNPVL